MEKILKKSGWISILESIVFAILGIILINKPEETVKFVAIALGAIFIGVGIYKIVNYYITKGKFDLYNFDFVYGIIAIIIGIVMITCSNMLGNLFRIMVGIWIIYSAIMRMSLAIKFKNLGFDGWIYSLIFALIMFACGMYVTLNSGAIVITIGIMIVVYAVIDIIEAIIFIRNIKEEF